MTFMPSLILTIGCIGSVHCVDKLCEKAKSCIGQSLNFTGRTGIYGYKAAFGPSTSYSGRELITCGASYSCHSMEYIIPTNSSHQYNTISCPASSSCSNTTLSNTSVLTCHGSDSCSFSNISGISQGLECHGYHSCANAYIYNTQNIQAKGAFSLYKTIIDTIISTTQTISIWLSGRLAGYDAQLTCRAGHTCNIYCEGFDSCYMLYTNCTGTCIVHTSSNDVHIPTNITNLSPFNKINLTGHKLFDTEIMEPNANALCTQDAWNFDDSGAQWFQDITVTTDNEGPVCCRGRLSCGGNKIEYQTTTKNNLLCSGQWSCFQSSISNIDTVFCEAVRACREASLISIHSLYCTGSGSCKHSTFVDVQYIICHGAESCINATFISGGSDLNVYLTGYIAGNNLTMNCTEADTCTIHCTGYNSCGIPRWICHDKASCIEQCHGTDCTMAPSAIPTLYPTLNPTDSITLNPTDYVARSYSTMVVLNHTAFKVHDSDEYNDAYLVISITSGGVILLCIAVIVCVYFCCRRKAVDSKRKATDGVRDDSQNEDGDHNMATDERQHKEDYTKNIDKPADDDGMDCEEDSMESLYVKVHDAPTIGNDQGSEQREGVPNAQENNTQNDTETVPQNIVLMAKHDPVIRGSTDSGNSILVADEYMNHMGGKKQDMEKYQPGAHKMSFDSIGSVASLPTEATEVQQEGPATHGNADLDPSDHDEELIENELNGHTIC
eukprot:365770_1